MEPWPSDVQLFQPYEVRVDKYISKIEEFFCGEKHFCGKNTKG